MSFLGGLVGGALGLVGNIIGGNKADEAASDNREFQAQMSNTSYQRGVADMRAAGLNPILAYSQGGASTPSGSVADTSSYADIANTGAKAMNTAMGVANIKNTNADTVKSETQSNLNDAQGALTRQQYIRQQLENEGLRALPPQYRALAQMAGSTGVGIAAGVKGISSIAKGVKSLPIFKSTAKPTHSMYGGYR